MSLKKKIDATLRSRRRFAEPAPHELVERAPLAQRCGIHQPDRAGRALRGLQAPAKHVVPGGPAHEQQRGRRVFGVGPCFRSCIAAIRAALNESKRPSSATERFRLQNLRRIEYARPKQQQRKQHDASVKSA